MTRGEQATPGPARARQRAVAIAFLLAFGLMGDGVFGLTDDSASAHWTSGSTVDSTGASSAATVQQGATPTASAASTSVTVTWAARTLSNGTAVSGYLVKRYDVATLTPQTVLSGCAGTVSATTCIENGVPAGQWVYSVTPVIATNWSGAASANSASVTISPQDTTAPTNAISLSSVTGGASRTGNTVFYRGVAAGSFTLTNAVADSGSGPASSTTAALTGTTTGWSHSPSTVSSPRPYVSAPFSWTAAATSSPTEVVTGRDVAGNAATTTLTFTNDSTAPTAGTVSYLNGTTTSTSNSVSFTTGTDAGSGIGTRLLQRASAPLTGTSCGTFGSFSTVANGTNPTSPVADAVTAPACYKYQYVVPDNVGNAATATSASVTSVNRSYFSSVTGTSGLISYWRLGEASGSVAADNRGVNPGVYAGGVTLGTTGAMAGDTNKSALFDGIDDVVSVPDSPSLKPALGISMEAWVKPNAGIQQYASIAIKTTRDDWDDGYGMNAINGGVAFWVNNELWSISTPAIPTTSWSHVVGTYDGSTLKIYLNGVLSTSSSNVMQIVHTTAPLLIGDAAGTGNYHWPGGIDEVAVYSRDLTAAEVAQHYAGR